MDSFFNSRLNAFFKIIIIFRDILKVVSYVFVM